MYDRRQLLLALGLALFAGLMWAAFIRARPREIGTGSITHKTFRPATVYKRFSRSERTSIPIAEAYSFEIAIDGSTSRASISLNTIASRGFEVGQRVRFSYERRGLPPLFEKLVLFDLALEP